MKYILWIAAISAVAGTKRPETLDLDWIVGRVHERVEERAGEGVVGVDPAVSEVSDQEVPASEPKPAGAMASPHGESRAPPEIRRLMKIPFVLN